MSFSVHIICLNIANHLKIMRKLEKMNIQTCIDFIEFITTSTSQKGEAKPTKIFFNSL